MSSLNSQRRVVRRARMLDILLVVFSTGMLVSFQLISFAALPQGTSRKIVSDDFTKNRKQTASVESRSKASPGQSSNKTPSKPRKQRTYRLASSSRLPISQTSAIAQLGITIWKVRRAKVNDTGARMLVREKGKSAEWVPERVEADATFREGDHLRLSIESPRAGYLYVVDRDLFKDGTTGDAKLIYPWTDMRGGDNQVSPGKLVDIPAQEDDPNYFKASPSGPDQVGEVLTIIVTKSQLDLPISDEPIQISNAELAKWEKMWGGESERFEMEGGAGEAWTEQEKQAAAKKNTRQLTRNDPAPQTIYRLTPKKNDAFLLNVRLSYIR